MGSGYRDLGLKNRRPAAITFGVRVKPHFFFWTHALRCVSFRCPGCGSVHNITIAPHKNASGASWTFTGDFDRPTLAPSINATSGPYPEGMKRAGQIDRCHSFINEGRIQFLGDCTHKLAGQFVDLPELSERELDAL